MDYIREGLPPSHQEGKSKQGGESYVPPTSHLRNLRQALKDCRRALEEFESALQEFEEITGEEEKTPTRSPTGQNLRLLSLPEVCQELRVDRVSVYRKLKSGEIPSLELGNTLKVRQTDLQEYIEGRHRSPSAQNGPLHT